MRTCECKKTRRGKKITIRKQEQFNSSLKGHQMKGRIGTRPPLVTSWPVQFTSLLQLGLQTQKRLATTRQDNLAYAVLIRCIKSLT